MVILVLTLFTSLFLFQIDYLPCILPTIVGFIIALAATTNMSATIPTINRICSVSKFTDCNKVSNSEFGTVMGIKMRDLATSYFLSQLAVSITYLLVYHQNPILSMYCTSAILFIPVTAYSTYSQVKIKRLCPICTILILCIASQSLIAIYYGNPFFSFNLYLRWLIFFMLIILILQLINRNKDTFKESKLLKIQLARVLRRKETVLSESINAGHIQSPICIGDNNSSKITTFISLKCPFCKDTVNKILQLKKNGINFQWHIVFHEEKLQDSYLIDFWIYLYHVDKDSFLDSLSKWARGGKISVDRGNPLSHREEEIRDLFRVYIKDLGIYTYPSIILNERLLSPIYDYNTACLLIEDSYYSVS